MQRQDELDPGAFGAAFKRFIDVMNVRADPGPNPFLERIRSHVGGEPAQLPVVAEEFERFEHPNLQAAIDHYLSDDGVGAELVGVAAQNKRFMSLGLSDLLSRTAVSMYMPTLAEGPVDYVNFRLEGDRVMPCVQFGLYLVRTPAAPLIAFVSGPSDQMGPRQKGRIEVMAASQEAASELLRRIVKLMRERSVYKGKVISLSPGQIGVQALVQFHSLPKVAREDVILPPGLLERIERQAIGFSKHRDALLASGRSLKRGMLLYGPPGVGKTLTVMHLASRMPDRTVLLTTGRGLGMVTMIAQMARTLEPSMVVMEDIDLIAQERGMPFQGPTGPVLFELLNEMDGLHEDADVIFVLTTNRPDILEPALAARPGRIDLVVELPLPDAEGRRRLFTLYARGLASEGVDVERFVQRTDGASPAYIKELLRKAAVLAATDDGGPIRIADEHIDAATDELLAGGRLAERILGFRPEPGEPSPVPPGAMTPMGFPGQARVFRASSS